MNKTSDVDRAGARVVNPAIWHVAGMALVAMAYRGVSPSAEGIKQWAAALCLAWAAGACVAGVAKLFGSRVFVRNWLIASWVAVALVVIGSWQVTPATTARPEAVDWEKGDIRPPAVTQPGTDWEKGDIKPPPQSR